MGVVLCGSEWTVEPGGGRREGEREDRVNLLLVLSEYICIAFRVAVLTFVTLYTRNTNGHLRKEFEVWELVCTHVLYVGIVGAS